MAVGQVLISAAEAAEMIIRVDDIVKVRSVPCLKKGFSPSLPLGGSEDMKGRPPISRIHTHTQPTSTITLQSAPRERGPN